jgi:hypothetical protein
METKQHDTKDLFDALWRIFQAYNGKPHATYLDDVQMLSDGILDLAQSRVKIAQARLADKQRLIAAEEIGRIIARMEPNEMKQNLGATVRPKKDGYGPAF